MMNKAQDLIEYLDAGGDFPPTLHHYAVELKKQHDLMLDALNSFMYEFGDKANSATVQKARAAIKAVKEQ